MSADSALILLGLMLVASAILYFVWLTEHPSDYTVIEHRKEGMETLKHIYEGTHHDERNDDGDQPISGVQR